MNKKYIVTLTADERAELQAMIAKGKRAARTLAHARILLKADVREEEPEAEWARVAPTPLPPRQPASEDR